MASIYLETLGTDFLNMYLTLRKFSTKFWISKVDQALTWAPLAIDCQCSWASGCWLSFKFPFCAPLLLDCLETLGLLFQVWKTSCGSCLERFRGLELNFRLNSCTKLWSAENFEEAFVDMGRCHNFKINKHEDAKRKKNLHVNNIWKCIFIPFSLLFLCEFYISLLSSANHLQVSQHDSPVHPRRSNTDHKRKYVTRWKTGI